MLAGASLDAEAFSSTEFSENSSNHPGRSCDQLPNAASMSSLFFCFRFCGISQLVSQCSTGLRGDAGLGVESSAVETCDIDVENVLVDELGGPVGNPGTTMGT